MSTGDAPPAGSTEQLTTSPSPTGADPGRIPLPPMSVPATAAVPESFLRRVRFLDGLLVLLLLVFAFLCGSFRASNSDVFLHLATGRQIAQGEFVFGSDPFTFTSQGVWVNHSWLYDLLLYLVYSSASWGGIALVVLKALAVAVAAWFMLRSATRPGQSVWVPAVFTALGVLALSPRLFLQPHIVSILLLSVTLYLLTRTSTRPRSVWLLPLVCVAWVNFDAWFLLGPAAVLLFLLGEAIQAAQRREGQSSDNEVSPKTLALVFAACLAACLVNPYHYRAFLTLPVGVVHGGAMSVFKGDSTFAGFFVSPFESVYLRPHFGLSAAGLSYFVLLALGALSFVFIGKTNLEGLRWWRFLLWTGTAGLSAWNFRAIPFFAVVAGPITALNFLDLAAKKAGEPTTFTAGARRWAVSGRVFSLVVGCVLALACVPGWPQSLPHSRRQVAWGVEIDESLRNACLTVEDWRTRGLIEPGQRWFNTSPDASSYFAWFCPGEKLFVDGRLGLFGEAATDFVAVRKSFVGSDGSSGQEAPREPAWRGVFTDRDVRFVVFHNSSLTTSNTAIAALLRLYSNPDEFAPCFTEGATAVFAWRSPRSKTPIDRRLLVDYNRSAFGPDAYTAPSEPGQPAGTRPWWRKVLEMDPPTPPATMTALQQMDRFEALSYRYQRENFEGWIATQLTSLAGLSAAPSGPLGAGILLPLRMQTTYLTGGGRSPIDDAARQVQQSYLRLLDTGPVASLYLSIRASRQGLQANPDDIFSQIYLAEAYSKLANRTRERPRTQGLVPHVGIIRQAQVATALQTVLKVSTRPEQQRAAHELLVNAYSDPLYFEVRVKHLREYFRLAQIAGPSQPVPQDKLGEYFKGLEATVKDMTSQLKQRRDQFELQSANKPVMEKAAIAMQNGLAETALNLLVRADPKDLRDRNNPREVPGAKLVVELLLSLGRIDDVRIALSGDPTTGVIPDSFSYGTHQLGMPAYEWFQVQIGAATGDYELADKSLAVCIEESKKTRTYAAILASLDLVPAEFAEKPTDAATVAATIVGSVLLREAPVATGTPWQIVRNLPVRLHPPMMLKEPGPVPIVRGGAQLLWRALEQQADLWATRAWLALEAGKVENAREYARQAMALSDLSGGDGKKVSFPFRSRPLTELVLELAENRVRGD